MKICFFLYLFVATCHAASEVEDWNSFKALHKKMYQNDVEEVKRKEIYNQNQLAINEHNQKRYEKGLATFRMKMNQFGDLTQQEFQRLNGLIVNQTQQNQQTSQDVLQHVSNQQDTPKSVDWRQSGAVTPVKNQGHCNSDWAFSAAGSLEGRNFKKNAKLVTLSAQQLIDCSRDVGNNGCQGGEMNQAFRYIKQIGGIQQDSSYSYQGQDQQCKFDKASVVCTVNRIFNCQRGDESQLQNAVAFEGPVSAGIDASLQTFQFYTDGVYSDANCNSQNLNRGVLVAGYGEEQNGQQYWLVKNSLGPNWGEQGYFKLARNKNNMCGIATMASYPEI